MNRHSLHAATLIAALVAGASFALPRAVAGQPDPSSWAGLAGVVPIAQSRSTPISDAALAVDPAHRERIAYCAPSAVQLSEDGGTTWTAIPTAPVVPDAEASGYPLLTTGGVPPACSSLALDPAAPGTVYAAFRAGKSPFGAPPIVFVPYVTTDAGASWSAVPPPPGLTPEAFGGFRETGGGVDALFIQRTAQSSGPPLVQRTLDSGASWAAAPFSCPTTGGCARWGAAPNLIGSCAMNGRIQLLLSSTDGGATWTDAGVGVNACVLNELVALSNGALLLLSQDTTGSSRGGGSTAIAHLSTDGGLSWADLSLPPLPGSAPRQIRGLLMLPDGSLIARVQGSGWALLRPGAEAWCGAGSTLPVPAEAADTATVIGDRLWWLENGDGGAPPVNREPLPVGIPLVNVSCGE